jgi:hypothetical protein
MTNYGKSPGVGGCTAASLRATIGNFTNFLDPNSPRRVFLARARRAAED